MVRLVPLPEMEPFQVLVTDAPDGMVNPIAVGASAVAPGLVMTNLPHEPPVHWESTAKRIVGVPPGDGLGAGVGAGAGAGAGAGLGVGVGVGLGVGLGAGAVPGA